MARATISAGLPAAGKTTWMRKYASESNALYLSADEVREELYGDASIQGDPSYIWSVVHQRAQNHLLDGGDVVIDGTFVKRVDRVSLVKALKGADCLELLWFTVPLQLCLERNRNRQRQVAEHALRRMDKQFRETPPVITEGFTRIILVP
jgi:predicted kinase